MIRTAAFAVVFVASACASNPLPDEPLIGGEWIVEDIDGKGIIDSSRATIAFTADRHVSGRATCNSYSGPYTINDAAISFGPVAATRMACTAEALMTQERRFLEALATIDHFEFSADGALVLSGPDGKSITARR
jgi:heat shock protein HslJ